MIKDIVGFRCDLHFDTSMPDGTMRKLLDVTRLNKHGWKYTTSLNKGLITIYKRYINNFEKC